MGKGAAAKSPPPTSQKHSKVSPSPAAAATKSPVGASAPPQPTSLQFGRFDGVEQRGGRREKKAKRDRVAALNAVEARQAEVAQAGGATTAEGQALLSKQSWGAALARASGEKVLDDPKLLKKSIKRAAALKEKRSNAWQERVVRALPRPSQHPFILCCSRKPCPHCRRSRRSAWRSGKASGGSTCSRARTRRLLRRLSAARTSSSDLASRAARAVSSSTNSGRCNNAAVGYPADAESTHDTASRSNSRTLRPRSARTHLCPLLLCRRARAPCDMDAAALHRALAALSAESADFVCGAIERLERPTAAEFARFVATNKPCVITGVASTWPAARLWTPEYLRCALAAAPDVLVNVTPDGRGDAIAHRPEHGGEVFVAPEERCMPFAAFLDLLAARTPGLVPYVSAQNDSLHTNFSALAADVPAEGLDWATEAFGSAPDAVNFWFGDSRSVTTFHSDPYENIYAVIRGEKRFTLLPPTDVHRLYRARDVRVGRYCVADDAGDGITWRVELEEPAQRVSWARVDPHPRGEGAVEGAAAAFPRFFGGAPPVEVTLRPGELLYLPSLWAHHVEQSDGTMAVNWWHDMRFDCRFALHQFVLQLSDALSDAEARGDSTEHAS